MFHDTLELRWFFRDKPGVAATLIRGNEESRIDHYAPIFGHHSSVKIREQSLEVKSLVAEAVGDASAPSRWSKTSIRIPPEEVQGLLKQVESEWLPVHKRRSLEFFDAEGSRHETSSKRADAVVQLEFTDVHCLGQRFWTVAVECPVALGPQAVDRCYGALLDQLPDHRFEHVPLEPRSYPEWLTFMVGEKGHAPASRARPELKNHI